MSYRTLTTTKTAPTKNLPDTQASMKTAPTKNSPDTQPLMKATSNVDDQALRRKTAAAVNRRLPSACATLVTDCIYEIREADQPLWRKALRLSTRPTAGAFIMCSLMHVLDVYYISRQKYE